MRYAICMLSRGFRFQFDATAGKACARCAPCVLNACAFKHLRINFLYAGLCLTSHQREMDNLQFVRSLLGDPPSSLAGHIEGRERMGIIDAWTSEEPNHSETRLHPFLQGPRLPEKQQMQHRPFRSTYNKPMAFTSQFRCCGM